MVKSIRKVSMSFCAMFVRVFVLIVSYSFCTVLLPCCNFFISSNFNCWTESVTKLKSDNWLVRNAIVWRILLIVNWDKMTQQNNQNKDIYCFLSLSIVWLLSISLYLSLFTFSSAVNVNSGKWVSNIRLNLSNKTRRTKTNKQKNKQNSKKIKSTKVLLKDSIWFHFSHLLCMCYCLLFCVYFSYSSTASNACPHESASKASFNIRCHWLFTFNFSLLVLISVCTVFSVYYLVCLIIFFLLYFSSLCISLYVCFICLITVQWDRK